MDTFKKYLTSPDFPSVGNYQNDKLMAEISAKEVDRLRANKSLGCDRFPPEWDKAMRGSILPLSKASFNYTLRGGPLPSS